MGWFCPVHANWMGSQAGCAEAASGTIRLQSRALEEEASDALDKTSQRIQTMAEVYDHLMLRDQTKIVDLKEYVGDIVRKLMALSGDKLVALCCELDEACIARSLSPDILA